MRETTIVFNGIALVLRGQFYGGESRTYATPPSDSDFSVSEVLCGSQDIIDILDENVLQEIEILAVKEIEEEQRDYDSLV